MLTKNRFYTVGMAGLVLEAQAGGNGAAIRLAQPTGEKNQEWKLVNGPDKTCCKLVNAQTKMVIDVALGGTDNGTWLHQWEDADVMTQEWTAQPTEDGLYKLLSRASGRCMDAGLVVEAGTALKLWDDVDGASQKWDIQEARKTVKAEPAKETTPVVEEVTNQVTIEEVVPAAEGVNEKEVAPVVEAVAEEVSTVEKTATEEMAPVVETPIQEGASVVESVPVVEVTVAEIAHAAAPAKNAPAKKNNRKKNRKGRK